MTQSSLLPLCNSSSPELQTNLLLLLADGQWRRREWIARELLVSVRAIRRAAHDCKGEVISSQQGLKLTARATQAELDEAIGRARSQISEMTLRIVQTLAVWNQRPC